MYENLTSDFKQFKKQISGKDKLELEKLQVNSSQNSQNIIQIRKNIILTIPSDYAGCGHIRNLIPMAYLNAVFGKSRRLQTISMPFFCTQKDILMKAKSILFQRMMEPRQHEIMKQIKEYQKQFKYKMVFDIDDFIWKGDNEGEFIPEYNFGSQNITDPVRETALKNMELCDTVTVSSHFLKKYLTQEKNIKTPIEVVKNTVPSFFYKTKKKEKIKTKITKPKIIYTGSPTHYHNHKKLKGDWDNAWYEYISKSIQDNNIDFICMGGCPWFFEKYKDKDNFTTIEWLNSYQYHLPILHHQADFNIAPLVPNYFNYSKSEIKMQEAYASGSAFIGTTFDNGMPSPYDDALIKLKNTCSINDIKETIERYCEPEYFNDIIDKQYKLMAENGWYLESPKHINKLLKIFA